MNLGAGQIAPPQPPRVCPADPAKSPPTHTASAAESPQVSPATSPPALARIIAVQMQGGELSARISHWGVSDPLYPPDDFASAFDAAAVRLRAAVAASCARPGPWPARVCAAIEAALSFAAADPAAARLLLVEPWAHGAAGTARRGLLLGGFAALLATGRRPPPGVSEQTLVGAIAGVLAERLLGEPGGEAGLRALGPDLAEFVLLPYLGPARAQLWARLGSERPAEDGEGDAVRRAAFAEVLGLLQGMIGADVQVVVNLLGHFFDCGFAARLERVESLAAGDGPVLVVFEGAQGIALDPAEVESFLGRLPGAPDSEWIEFHVAGSLRLVIEALSESGAD